MIYCPVSKVICELGRPGCAGELLLALPNHEPLNTLCERLDEYLTRRARDYGWLVETSGRTVCPACTIKEAVSNGKS